MNKSLKETLTVVFGMLLILFIVTSPMLLHDIFVLTNVSDDIKCYILPSPKLETIVEKSIVTNYEVKADFDDYYTNFNFYHKYNLRYKYKYITTYYVTYIGDTITGRFRIDGQPKYHKSDTISCSYERKIKR